MDEYMVQPLQASLDHYKQLKMVNDVAKEIEEQTINPKVYINSVPQRE